MNIILIVTRNSDNVSIYVDDWKDYCFHILVVA